MFMVKLNPNIPPKAGNATKAMNMDKGTDSATNMALVTPMKNIKINVTSINPIMMVFIKSCNVTLVLSD
jgi:hypothetical protein